MSEEKEATTASAHRARSVIAGTPEAAVPPCPQAPWNGAPPVVAAVVAAVHRAWPGAACGSWARAAQLSCGAICHAPMDNDLTTYESA